MRRDQVSQIDDEQQKFLIDPVKELSQQVGRHDNWKDHN